MPLGLRYRVSQPRAEDNDFSWGKICLLPSSQNVCMCDDNCYRAETHPKFFSGINPAAAMMITTAIELQTVHDLDHVSGSPLAIASGLSSSGPQVTRSDATAAPRLEDVPRNGSSLVDRQDPSRFTTTIVIALVTLVTALSSLLAGVITVAIPSVAVDIDLSPNLILWCVK
jgi:hypothetical protein